MDDGSNFLGDLDISNNVRRNNSSKYVSKTALFSYTKRLYNRRSGDSIPKNKVKECGNNCNASEIIFENIVNILINRINNIEIESKISSAYFINKDLKFFKGCGIRTQKHTTTPVYKL